MDDDVAGESPNRVRAFDVATGDSNPSAGEGASGERAGGPRWSVDHAHQVTHGPVPVDVLGRLFQCAHRLGQGLPGRRSLPRPAPRSGRRRPSRGWSPEKLETVKGIVGAVQPPGYLKTIMDPKKGPAVRYRKDNLVVDIDFRPSYPTPGGGAGQRTQIPDGDRVGLSMAHSKVSRRF